MGLARVVEVVDADEARLAWKEASNVAVAARQHADTMQVAAGKAVGLARVLEAACPTAKNVAQGTANLAETAFWKKRKHEEQEEARKAANMDDEDNQMNKGQVQIEEDEIEGYARVVIVDEIDKHAQVVIVSREEADADKAGRAWRETYELADLAGQYANRMKCRAAKAVSLAEDLEAKCAKAKGAAQRTAHIAETALSKKRKGEEQEEDRKKRMATLQEEARKRNDEEGRKRQRAATSGSSSSSTERNEQQQRQHRLRPRPPDYPPPGRMATPSVKRSPPSSWMCKK